MKIISTAQIFDGSENVGGVNAVIKGWSTTRMIELHAVNALALFCQAVNAAGTTSFKIEMYTYYKDDIANAIEPDGASDIFSSIADTNVHHASFAPPATKWLAIKVTGLGANEADARMKVWLVMQVGTW